ncbi:MAG: adenylate kinase, partial [Planctomycetota bacterium]
MRLVFLGPPGAGKGTQAQLLAEKQGLLHLSTGDMFRGAISRGTPTGLQAKSFMDRGQLVPDSVVDALVDERLKEQDARGGFLLDGYPRNLTQAEALEAMLATRGTPLTAVLYLDVADEILIARIAKRGQDSGGARADDT